MTNEKFAKGVVQEQPTALNPTLEAYWVSSGKNYQRIKKIGSSVVEDGEISWTEARVDAYVSHERSRLQSLFGLGKRNDVIEHPSGFDVVPVGTPPRKGFLVTGLQENIDIESEIFRRLVGEKDSHVISISSEKAFLTKGTPVSIHAIDQSVTLDHLSDRLLPVEQVEANYKAILDSLPDLIAKRSSFLAPEDVSHLYKLLSFTRDQVRWARIDDNWALSASERGQIGNAWIFTIPPGHQKLDDQQATHAVGCDDNGLNPYLGIRPHDMTERWSALALVHELSHLQDFVTGIEPKTGKTRDQYLEGEHRAYSIEKALAFSYSEGKLQKLLESLVEQAIKNGDDAVHSLANERLPAIATSLDQCLEPHLPKSKAELGVRQGLYMMLIGFEIAKQYSKGDKEQQKRKEKTWIEMLYEPTGHLPPK